MAGYRNLGRATAAAAAVLLSAGAAWGQEKATAKPLQKKTAGAVQVAKPAGAPKKAEEAKNDVVGTFSPILVEAVEGTVGFKKAAGAPITAAKAGDKLQEGAVISVGFNSAVRIRIGASQLFTFDHAGQATIRRAINDGKTDITRINLTLGRVTFDVTSTHFANDVRIETPEMTLAIKGTIGGVEVTPGHPTRVFGDVENKGLIEVDWVNGLQKVPFTGNDRADASTQNPAKQQEKLATGSTRVTQAQEAEEDLVEKRQPGGGTTESTGKDLGVKAIPNDIVNTMPNLPVGHPVPGTPHPGTVLHLNNETGDLYETDTLLGTSLVRQALSIDPAATDGGSAVLTNTAGGEPVLVRLETTMPTVATVKNRFLGLELTDPHSDFRLVRDVEGAAADTPALRGLGAIRDQLYGVGSLGGRDSIYHIDLGSGALAPVMSMGITLEGALTGGNERGTLFAFGIEAGYERPGTSLLDRGVLLEIDPRTNYLLDAQSGLNGAFSSGAGIGSPSLNDLGSVLAVTGLGYVNGLVMLGAVVDSSGGRTAIIEFDPQAGSVAGALAIRAVRVTPEAFTNGLASENGAAPAPSVALSDPAGQIDMTTINAAFARMAYSPRAWQSGFVDRALSAEILRTALDPAGCAASGALGSLHGLLGEHVNERAGVGRTVADFRGALPPMHPCGPDMH
jgi:hypothetical protein